MRPGGLDRAQQARARRLAAELDGLQIVREADDRYGLGCADGAPLSETERTVIARALVRGEPLHTACARALRVYDPTKQPACAEVPGW